MLSQPMREIVELKRRLTEVERRQSEFTELLHTGNRSDIDYIAMETGIELDQEEEEA